MFCLPSSSWNTTSKFLLQSDTEKFLVAFRDWATATSKRVKIITGLGHMTAMITCLFSKCTAYETALWYSKETLTESRIVCRVIFRQVLVRGLLEWMCLSSRWKKFTLSWNVSEPPVDNTIKLLLQSPQKTVLTACSSGAKMIRLKTNQCSCAGSEWRWRPWCSCLCSWAPREAVSHHPPLELSTCELGQDHNR